MGAACGWQRRRGGAGPVYVLNGDELIDADLAALLAAHRARGGAATTSRLLADADRLRGRRARPRTIGSAGSTSRRSSRIGCNAGVDVLDEEAIARLPEKGDHERTTFPELAAEGKLYALRHEGLWLTVNTPKDLRTAEEHIRASPNWLAAAARHDHGSPELGRSGAVRVEPTKVDKPWGHELIWALTDDYCGKILFVRAGESLSLQFHREKDESWLVHSGRAEIEMGSRARRRRPRRSSAPGAAFRIRPGRCTG